jgi:hypothetical protein
VQHLLRYLSMEDQGKLVGSWLQRHESSQQHLGGLLAPAPGHLATILSTSAQALLGGLELEHADQVTDDAFKPCI